MALNKLTDGQIRELVNDLTTIGYESAGTQHLRSRISNRLVPVLKGINLPSPKQVARSQFTQYVREHFKSSYHDMFCIDSSGRYTATVQKKTGTPDIVKLQTLWEIWNHGSK